MCGCDYICVSSFTRLKKINSRVLWRIKGSLCVVRAYFLREPLRPCLLVCGHLPALVRALRRLLTFSIRACVFVCPGKASELVMRACHPLHASPCATVLHMTSIWAQWDSDLITNSLLLIKTCRLQPPLPFPSLFLSFLLSPSFTALLCFLVLCLPPSCFFHPSTPESHHSVVSPLPAAKKGPISSSAKSYKLPSFFLFSFGHFFVLSSLLYIFRPSLSQAELPQNFYLQASEETLLTFLIPLLSQSALTVPLALEQKWKWKCVFNRLHWCEYASARGYMCKKGCSVQVLEIHKYTNVPSTLRCCTLTSSLCISLTQKHKQH